ncbi:MAG TPA: hypothetical protein VMU85_11540 [Stellaceae bacterium]|nr:hypothetical protein [Stellaceae bacterium]
MISNTIVSCSLFASDAAWYDPDTHPPIKLVKATATAAAAPTAAALTDGELIQFIIFVPEPSEPSN